MNPQHYPGVRLMQRLTDAGLLAQFEAVARARSYAQMKALIEQVAESTEERQEYTGVVFANPEHYDRVISDLHYDGKTVNERLAVEGLQEQFAAALHARDAARLVEVLQEAAIAKTWAARLATRLLDGPPEPPIRLAADDPRNAGLRNVRNELRFPPCMRPSECPRDPYWSLGSHPECVERVWDQLASTLPQDCRCVVFGTPGLVAPRSGILLAAAFGTRYILRIPLTAVDDALRQGLRPTMTWGKDHVTDLKQEYGDDWLFGTYLAEEAAWLRAAFEAVEH